MEGEWALLSLGSAWVCRLLPPWAQLFSHSDLCCPHPTQAAPLVWAWFKRKHHLCPQTKQLTNLWHIIFRTGLSFRIDSVSHDHMEWGPRDQHDDNCQVLHWHLGSPASQTNLSYAVILKNTQFNQLECDCVQRMRYDPKHGEQTELHTPERPCSGNNYHLYSPSDSLPREHSSSELWHMSINFSINIPSIQNTPCITQRSVSQPWSGGRGQRMSRRLQVLHRDHPSFCELLFPTRSDFSSLNSSVELTPSLHIQLGAIVFARHFIKRKGGGLFEFE